jgi:DNA-binding transcriptional regulator YiaG
VRGKLKVTKKNLVDVRDSMAKARQVYHLNTKDRDNFHKLLGKRIKFARLCNNKTQTKVGRALNVSFQQIQKYEKGDNEIKAFDLFRVANFLGTTVKWLLKPAKHKEDLNG